MLGFQLILDGFEYIVLLGYFIYINEDIVIGCDYEGFMVFFVDEIESDVEQRLWYDIFLKYNICSVDL